MMQVGELLPDHARKLLTLPTGCLVKDAVEQIAQEEVEAAVVTKANRPVGMFSGHELMQLLQKEPPEAFYRTAVGEVMTERFVVAAPEEEVRQVMGKMLNAEIRHLVIFSGDTILGQLALCDIVKKMFEILDGEVRHLNDYIADLHEAGTD
jgi:predicted transcriptional regulator